MDNLYSLSVYSLILLFIHYVLCSLESTSKAVIMHLRRTKSSRERSNENGYNDDHKETALGGTPNDSCKEKQKQKRHKNHLSINWKGSQSSVDNSRCSTPIFGKGIRAYVGKFINFTPLYNNICEQIKTVFILIIYRG